MVAELGNVDRRGVSELHRNHAGFNRLDEAKQLQRNGNGEKGGRFLRLSWISIVNVGILEQLCIRTRDW